METNNRNREIYLAIESGKTCAETAREYGLSRERIRQIYIKKGGVYRKKITAHKKERAKLRELRHKNILELAQEYVQTLGYIPPIGELLKFMHTIKCGYLTKRIKKELLRKNKLPQFSEINREIKREKMISDLKRIYFIIKKPVGRKDLKEFAVKRYETYYKTFGSYKNACILAGIPCPKKGNYRKTSPGNDS